MLLKSWFNNRLTVLVFIFCCLKCQFCSSQENFKHGVEAFKNKDWATVEKIMLPFAKRGNVDAQFYYGFAVLQNPNSQTSRLIGEKWLRIAAEAEHVEAMRELALLNLTGKYEIKQDLSEAQKWFHKAAMKQDPISMYHLGLIFLEGKGVDIDKRDAAKWFEQAFALGYIEAGIQLAKLYMIGDGVIPDVSVAFRLFQNIAEKSAKGKFLLGQSFDNGRGTEVNLEKAAEAYYQAAKEDNIEAFGALGGIFEEEGTRFFNPQKAWICFALGKTLCEKNGEDKGIIYQEFIRRLRFLEKRMSIADLEKAKNDFIYGLPKLY